MRELYTLPQPWDIDVKSISQEDLIALINKNVLLTDGNFGYIISIDPDATSLDEMDINIVLTTIDKDPPPGMKWIYRTCSLSGVKGLSRYWRYKFKDIVKKEKS